MVMGHGAARQPEHCQGRTTLLRRHHGVNPIVQFGIRPTDKVGVIGIGGLGHIVLQFLK